MRGDSNVRGKSFDASLSGEITQKNKSLNDDFLQASGQYVDITDYPDIGGMFPLSSTDIPSLTRNQQGDILGYSKDGRLLLYVINDVQRQVSIYEGTAKVQLPNYSDEYYIRVRGHDLIKLLIIILLFFHNERRGR